ncbi:MAG: diphthine--ammonia ligase [Kiritimatiellae bacterium]|nr:diphthine--ammonia ligase [Kiritimatiellia bacterium]
MSDSRKLDGNAFCSWSGGKDSCLALHRARQAGARPACLITMMIEDGQRSRSHGLRQDVVDAQAAAMGLPLFCRATSWSEYEASFIDVLAEVQAAGMEAGIFGDIDLQDHRDWVERVCAKAGMQAMLPLWNEPRLDMVRECIDAGIDCRIVSCKAELMGREYLGKALTRELAESLEAKGIDACGENGEFHTAVVNGPMFHTPLELEAGGVYEHGGHWALDYHVGSISSSAK